MTKSRGVKVCEFLDSRSAVKYKEEESVSRMFCPVHCVFAYRLKLEILSIVHFGCRN